MDNEVTPILDDVPGIDLSDYKRTLIARFANPNIKDSLTRICSQSASKVSTFLVPTILENFKIGGNTPIANLVIAAWCLYSDTHSSQQGKPLEVIDDIAETLQQAAHASRISPLAFLEQPSIFGPIIENKSFCDEYKYYISKLYAGVAIEHIMEALLSKVQVR